MRSSFEAVVISELAPLKIRPVDPIVFPVRVCVEVVSARVILPDGRVAFVMFDVVNVRLLAPENATVVALGMVSVPVVLVTVRPLTFSALNA